MVTIGSVIRKTAGFSLMMVALASGIGGCAAMIGRGWKDFSSRDRLTFLACSAYDRQLYVGFMTVKRPATLTNFDDTERPGGSWSFLWRCPDGKWAWKSLGPEVDFGCMPRKPGPEPVFEYRIGRCPDDKFAGLYFRCENSLLSFSLAGEPMYRRSLDKMVYRRNGATSIQANIPGWILCGLSAAGLLPTGLRLHRRLRSNRRRKSGRCPKSNYALRASPSLCPECGKEIEKVE